MKITDLIPWRRSGRDVAVRTESTDPIRALQLDVDRAFDNFWHMVPYRLPVFGQLEMADTIRVDVSDNGKEIMVEAELPGMSAGDIDLSVGDGQLTIRSEKKSDRQSEEGGIIVRERVYGAVERNLPLPESIDPDAAKATFRDGLLRIVVPKLAESQTDTKRIPVQAG